MNLLNLNFSTVPCYALVSPMGLDNSHWAHPAADYVHDTIGESIYEREAREMRAAEQEYYEQQIRETPYYRAHDMYLCNLNLGNLSPPDHPLVMWAVEIMEEMEQDEMITRFGFVNYIFHSLYPSQFDFEREQRNRNDDIYF